MESYGGTGGGECEWEWGGEVTVVGPGGEGCTLLDGWVDSLCSCWRVLVMVGVSLVRDGLVAVPYCSAIAWLIDSLHCIFFLLICWRSIQDRPMSVLHILLFSSFSCVSYLHFILLLFNFFI